MFKFNCYFPRVLYKANKIDYGSRLKLVGWPMIFRYPKATIKIGNDCIINSNFFSNFIGLYQRSIIISRDNAKITIGDHVGISGSTIYARESIEIGNHVLIGANTKIFDNDFHSLDVEARKNDDFSKLDKQKVKIGNNVFIGCNCIILKGTQLGNNCIVGAGSVVHGVYEDNCVIAGNPARVIRKND